MTHDCGICEYTGSYFLPLKNLNRLIRICKQGRIQRGMRQTARDQARLRVEPDNKENKGE